MQINCDFFYCGILAKIATTSTCIPQFSFPSHSKPTQIIPIPMFLSRMPVAVIWHISMQVLNANHGTAATFIIQALEVNNYWLIQCNPLSRRNCKCTSSSNAANVTLVPLHGCSNLLSYCEQDRFIAFLLTTNKQLITQNSQNVSMTWFLWRDFYGQIEPNARVENFTMSVINPIKFL